MDVDFWAARVHTAKHLSDVQAARLNNSESHLTMDDEGEDDVRACFPCPFCSVEFLMLIHGGEIKKSGIWSNASVTVGKDLRGLTSFLGSNSLNCLSDRNEPAPDPLLSPFLCSATFSDPKDYKQDVSCTFADSSANAESIKPTLSDAVQEQDYEERMQRPAFFQEVIMSTIF